MISYRCPMGPKICLGEVKPCSKHIHPVEGKDSSSWATWCDQLSLSLLPLLLELSCYFYSYQLKSNIEDYYCQGYDWTQDFDFSDSHSLTKRLKGSKSRFYIRIMSQSQGEGGKYWSNQNRRSIGSVSEDEQPTSPIISDVSEDSHLDFENDKANNNGEEGVKTDSCDDGQPSPFLFLGPVGKKRKIVQEVRQRHISEGSSSPPNHRISSPLSPSDPNSPLSNFEQSLSLSPTSPLSSEMRPRRASASKTSTVTSSTYTITEDQPLNLCLATGSVTPNASGPGILTKNPTDFPSTSPELIIFPQEEHDTVSAPLTSPSFSFSARSERESGEESLYGVPSPTPSASLSPSSSIQMYNRRNSNAPNYVTTGSSPTKRKLQCPDCGKEFSQLRNYRYHRSRHEGTSQFACTCPICGKSFNDKGYLSSHLKIHRNAKEYQCEWCEKSFNQRVAYNMHVRIHTGHKPHKCHICPKAFSRKMLLRQHLRTHTGERPYSCEICGKAFADRSNMLLHQRLHSGQRPYKCDICGKSFSKNHHLKTHLNHHAGIKPYQCGKCGATFSQSSNMKTHFRKCSGTISSSGNLSTNSSAPSSPGSNNSLFTSPMLHATSTSSGFLPSFSTHLRSHFPSSHLSGLGLAQQLPSLTQEQATSFQALMHDQIRSSSNSILHSSQSSPSSSVGIPGSSSGSSLTLLPGLRSPPLIAGPPEKFGTSKMYSRSGSQLSGGQVQGQGQVQPGVLTKAFQKQFFQQQQQQQQQQLHMQQQQQQQQPPIHFSTLESSASVLAKSPLSPASSLLLLNPSKEPAHHHQYQHRHSSSHSHSNTSSSRVIHYTNPNPVSATSTISEYLESASEPMTGPGHHHQQALHQHHLLQQHQMFQSHSPPSSSSISSHSYSSGSHSHGQSSSSHLYSHQQSQQTISLVQATGHMPISLHHPIPLSPTMAHHHLLQQHIPMPVQSHKIPTVAKIPRNVTITNISTPTKTRSPKVVPAETFTNFPSRPSSTSSSQSHSWQDAPYEELKQHVKQESNISPENEYH